MNNNNNNSIFMVNQSSCRILCMLSLAGWLPRVWDQLWLCARLRVWVPLPLEWSIMCWI